jgi:GTPase
MNRIVAIVGRPNVGKSTFFNRLVGQRVSIEDSTSGVTRDRIYGKSDWNGMEFSVIDTGGYIEDSEDFFDKAIRSQVNLAIEEADVILFIMDVTEGITPYDEDLSRLLRNSIKPVFAVANKADNNQRYLEAAEFYSLGFEKIWPISAVNGSGTGDLLDEVVKLFPDDEAEEILPELPKFCIVGRPNAGKSSLLNALLGHERSIVTPIAGTTRDSIHSHYSLFGFDFLLIDTAGMRKRSNVNEDLEFYSYVRAIRAIETSDVCLLIIDAERGIESQDLSIFKMIVDNNKGVVILVNKWDLVQKETNTSKAFEAQIKERLAPFRDVPIVFISALTKQRIHKSIETAFEVYKNRTQRITTSKLNEMLLPLIQGSPPPVYKGKRVKVKYITQLPTHYPSFVFFCNLPQYVKDPYKRFVENQMRAMYDFSGVSVKLYFRQK